MVSNASVTWKLKPGRMNRRVSPDHPDAGKRTARDAVVVVGAAVTTAAVGVAVAAGARAADDDVVPFGLNVDTAAAAS